MAVERRISRPIRAALLAGPAFSLMACSPRKEQGSNSAMAGMMEDDMPMIRDMPDWMMSGEGMMGPGMMRDMRPIHGLPTSHDGIERRAEGLPNGVRTIATSDDPQVAELISSHVDQMKTRYGRGHPIRMMDPVFQELFRNRDNASLEFEDIPVAIHVTHTSDDPQVVLLIRQHARRFVSEAAKEGMSRAMRPTPLLRGYRPPSG